MLSRLTRASGPDRDSDIDPQEIIPPFLEHKASRIDPAWKSQPLGRTLSREANQPKTVEATQQWKTFITAHVANTEYKDFQTFDVKNKYTIKDVRREGEAALELYESKASRNRNWFQRNARKFLVTVPAFEVLLQFLPNDAYGSILCGALTALFNAAKRLKALRKCVFTCLSSLSSVFDTVDSYIRLYEDDKALQTAAENLYVALLEAVQSIISWLHKPGYKRAFGALFQQSSYGEDLEAKVKDDVDDKVAEFRNQITCCLHRRMKTTSEDVVEILTTIPTITSLLHENIDVFKANQQMPPPSEPLQNSTTIVQQTYNICHPVVTIQQAPERPYMMVKAQLRDLLNVETDVNLRDLNTAAALGHTMSTKRQARIIALLQNARFQAWIRTSSSDVIAINGMERDAGWDNDSTLTFFTALLHQTFERTNAAITLSFFCGQRATANDDLEGAAGLLRSLCAQLLLASHDSLDLSFLGSVSLGQMDMHDIQTLCWILRGLVFATLPSANRSAIVCLLDEISIYETDARIQGLQYAMSFLRSLVEEIGTTASSSLIFKVLATSSGASSSACQWLPEECIVSMEEEVLRRWD